MKFLEHHVVGINSVNHIQGCITKFKYIPHTLPEKLNIHIPHSLTNNFCTSGKHVLSMTSSRKSEKDSGKRFIPSTRTYWVYNKSILKMKI